MVGKPTKRFRLKNSTAVKIELIDMDNRPVDLCITVGKAQT